MISHRAAFAGRTASLCIGTASSGLCFSTSVSYRICSVPVVHPAAEATMQSRDVSRSSIRKRESESRRKNGARKWKVEVHNLPEIPAFFGSCMQSRYGSNVQPSCSCKRQSHVFTIVAVAVGGWFWVCHDGTPCYGILYASIAPKTLRPQGDDFDSFGCRGEESSLACVLA